MEILKDLIHWTGLHWWLRCWRICPQCGRPGVDPWVRKISCRREWLLTPVFLPEESYGQRSLAGYWATNTFTFIDTILYIRSSHFTNIITESLYFFTNLSLFLTPLSPRPWQPLFYFLFLWVWLSHLQPPFRFSPPWLFSLQMVMRRGGCSKEK